MPNTIGCPLEIGIKGFGRIGRAVARHLILRGHKIKFIYDKKYTPKRAAYFLSYDSVYGRFSNKVSWGNDFIQIGEDRVAVYNSTLPPDLTSVEADVIVDASGAPPDSWERNQLENCPVVATQSINGVNIIIGVNETQLKNSRPPRIIGTSICDVVALAPLLGSIYDEFGAINFVKYTSIHSWLSSQSLLDNAPDENSTDDETRDLSIGRAASLSVIPKTTSVCSVLERTFPWIKGKTECLSFRVPTPAVSMAIVEIGAPLSFGGAAAIAEILKSNLSHIYEFGFDAVVSSDFVGLCKSAYIDLRWLSQNAERSAVKFVMFFDNEWGYSSRVVDILEAAYCRDSYSHC